jgi:general secretion pathway protein A
VYETFFGLESSPFGLTPDPRFLFRSNGHHDVLSSLLYGVTTNKGIMLLLGDVGMGKTTLCRALLRELPAPARGLFLLNPHYSETELVGAILDGLGLERRGSTRGALMTVLEEHLMAAGDSDKIVIVVDEAQQLSVEALEQLRIISTLEAPDRKLLHIVLAGQPELEEKLARPELRQLNQRIAVRCRLEPLSERETLRYIEHRLRAAGCGGRLPFTPAASARVYRCSRGVPRVINPVCDRALVSAYADRRRDIDVDTVNAAIISLQARRPRARWRPEVAVAAAIAGLIVIGTAVGLQSTWRHRWLPRLSNGVLAWAAPRPAPATVPSSAPVAMQAAAVTPVAAVPLDPQRRLLAQLIALWIRQSPSRSDMAEWPSLADGTVDIASVAKRYQLTATSLPRITAVELRAIGLPALVRLDGTQDSRMLLLRHIDRDTVTFVDGTGTEHRRQFSELESTLAAAEAWIVWQNLDQLVLDSAQPMTPTMVLTLALRLHKLGYLAMPLPRAYDARLAEAVRAFQRSTGLADDGIPGPRTILALYRVVASTLAPSVPSEGRR